ncbi:hypothetical protein T09_7969 [Trichinella sp. T9]|nr:hypothetical protein T09_7969 [Trichinella sp. T9]
MGFEKSVCNFSHNTTSRPATWSVRVVFNLGQRRKICYWGLSTECQSERAYGLFVLLLGSVGDEAHLDHTVRTTVAGEQAGSGRPGAAGVDELLAPAGVESALDHLLLYLVTPAGALDDKFELGLRASFEPAGAGRMFDVVTGRVDRGAADDRVRDRRPAVRVGQTSTLEHEAVAEVFVGVVEAPAAVGNAAFQFGAHRTVRFGRTGVPEVADGKGSADRHRRPVGRVDARLADRRHRIAPSGAAEDERTAPERRAYRQPVAGIVHAAAHFQRQTVVAFDARVPEFDAFAVGGDRAPQLVAALAGRLANGDPAVTAVADRACDRHSLARSAPVPDEADPALFAFVSAVGRGCRRDGPIDHKQQQQQPWHRWRQQFPAARHLSLRTVFGFKPRSFAGFLSLSQLLANTLLRSLNVACDCSPDSLLVGQLHASFQPARLLFRTRSLAATIRDLSDIL